MKLDVEIWVSNLFSKKFTNFINHNANFMSTVKSNQSIDKDQKKKALSLLQCCASKQRGVHDGKELEIIATKNDNLCYNPIVVLITVKYFNILKLYMSKQGKHSRALLCFILKNRLLQRSYKIKLLFKQLLNILLLTVI